MNKLNDSNHIRLQVNGLVKGLVNDCSCFYISQDNMERYDIYRGDMLMVCSLNSIKKLAVVYSEDLDDIELDDRFVYLSDYLMRNLNTKQGEFIEICKIEEDIPKVKEVRFDVFHESELSRDRILKGIRDYLVKDNRPLNKGDILGIVIDSILVEFKAVFIQENESGIVHESTDISINC